jgi:hypothetical protein
MSPMVLLLLLSQGAGMQSPRPGTTGEAPRGWVPLVPYDERSYRLPLSLAR